MNVYQSSATMSKYLFIETESGAIVGFNSPEGGSFAQLLGYFHNSNKFEVIDEDSAGTSRPIKSRKEFREVLSSWVSYGLEIQWQTLD